MPAARAKKLSISLPANLAKELKRHAGSRGVSAYAAKAIREELVRDERRRRLADYLAELDAQLGPVPDEDLEEARQLWRKVSS